MVGFEDVKVELEAASISVVAVSVDDEKKAAEVAADVSFPVAHSATRADSNAIGAWWGDARGIIQPSEFLIDEDGKIIADTYSSGPIGRMDATDVVKLVNLYEARKKKG